MDDDQMQKQAERIVKFLNSMQLEDFMVNGASIGKSFDSNTYRLELGCKTGAGFILITMNLPEAL